jgi:aminoglycoside phosphotransferase (APT) family kinase protein
MLPSELNILQRVRKTVLDVRNEIGDVTHRNQLAALDSALKELILRCDTGFFHQHYRLGKALLDRGMGLLGNNSAPNLNSHLPDSIPPEADRRTLERYLEALNDSLLSLTLDFQRSGLEDSTGLLADITDWEDRPYAHRSSLDQNTAAGPSHGYTRDRLQAYLTTRFPDRPNLHIEDFTVLAGGFSKLTILFSTQDNHNGQQSFVIRANQAVQNIKIEGADVNQEFELIRRLFDAGIPVAEPLWLESDTGHFGTAFFVSRKAQGIHLGSGHTAQTYGEITADTKASLIDVMTGLHDTVISSSPVIGETFINSWTPYKSLNDIARASIDHWCEEADRHGATRTPRIQRLIHWLKQNAPDDNGDVVLVHGDFGLHNILFQDGQITAVLDWEIAKMGDPAEDLITLFISLGGYDEELLDLYQSRTGKRISRYRLIYYHLVIILRILLFKQSAMKNLDENPHASNDLFKWLEMMHLQAKNINNMITEAERCRAE